MIFLKFIMRRLLMMAPILVGISVLSFVLGILAPSDPALVLLTMDGQSEPSVQELAAMREKLGLNDSYLIQYSRWLFHLVQGDFGISYINGIPVFTSLLERLPVTFELSIMALLVLLSVAIPIGIYTALKKNTLIDRGLRIMTMSISAIPGFWLALVLIHYFAEQWQLLPTSGYGSFEQLILPAVVLCTGSLAVMSRLYRSAIIGQQAAAYVLTERSQGLPGGQILRNHILPNAVLPVVTYLGSYMLAILGGSVVVESIFALPGLGNLVLEAIRGRDYPVIQGYVVFMGILVVAVNLTVDISYFFLNPKLRAGGRYDV